MKYYLVMNMRQEFNYDENGKEIGCISKLPLSIKPYCYYRISSRPPWSFQCLIQSEDEIPNNKDCYKITLEQAQKIVDEWARQCKPVILEYDENGKEKTTLKTPEKIISYNKKEIKTEMKRLYSKYGEKKGG